MAVENNLLGGNDLVNGSRLYAGSINDTFNEILQQNYDVFRLNGLSNIKFLNKNQTFYSDNFIDEFGDIFTSETGLFGSVQTGNTNLIYNFGSDCFNLPTNRLSGTLHNPDSFSNTSNMSDNDFSTYANRQENVGNFEHTFHIGSTFSSQYIEAVSLKARIRLDEDGDGPETINQARIKLEINDGGGWNDFKTLRSGTLSTSGFANASGTFFVGSTLTGVRIEFYGEDNDTQNKRIDYRLHELQYGSLISGSLVTEVPNFLGSSNIFGISTATKEINSDDEITYQIQFPDNLSSHLNVGSINYLNNEDKPKKLLFTINPNNTDVDDNITGFNGYWFTSK